MADDPWDPKRYERFRDERAAPFRALLAEVAPAPGGLAVDLGCGTGALTAELHRKLGARLTLGLDLSEEMLSQARAHAGRGVVFARADLAAPPLAGRFDVVLSNAALHWLPDHRALFARVFELVAPGGQLAIQVPSNDAYPSHRLARDVACEEPFRTALKGFVRETPVLDPEAYVSRLGELGAADVRAETRVFEHELPEPKSVVNWVRGTTLTAYERRLSENEYEAFVARYTERLLDELPDVRPFVYPFQRTFIRARRPRP